MGVWGIRNMGVLLVIGLWVKSRRECRSGQIDRWGCDEYHVGRH